MYKFFREIRLAHISFLFIILYDVRLWGWIRIAFNMNVRSCVGWRASSLLRLTSHRNVFTAHTSHARSCHVKTREDRKSRLVIMPTSLNFHCDARKALYATSFPPRLSHKGKVCCLWAYNSRCFTRFAVLASQRNSSTLRFKMAWSFLNVCLKNCPLYKNGSYECIRF